MDIDKTPQSIESAPDCSGLVFGAVTDHVLALPAVFKDRPITVSSTPHVKPFFAGLSANPFLPLTSFSSPCPDNTSIQTPLLHPQSTPKLSFESNLEPVPSEETQPQA
ncbi:hypothetical protein Bca4012_081934 [Brassica carinata]|uniref:Uncharacterized protein n=1 Tax=Brassica carinata TaxID=52824 RepID=A0A8X7VD72_BRACI|nr:hypothetical protein Bca52824_028897 [Brassica carinata]